MDDCTHPRLDFMIQAFVALTVDDDGVVGQPDVKMHDARDFVITVLCTTCDAELDGMGSGTLRSADGDDSLRARAYELMDHVTQARW